MGWLDRYCVDTIDIDGMVQLPVVCWQLGRRLGPKDPENIRIPIINNQ